MLNAENFPPDVTVIASQLFAEFDIACQRRSRVENLCLLAARLSNVASIADDDHGFAFEFAALAEELRKQFSDMFLPSDSQLGMFLSELTEKAESLTKRIKTVGAA